MFWELVNTAVPFLAIPVVGSYGYWRYHRHLFGIYGEEEKLSYSKDKIPFDESTQKVIDELMMYITERWSPYHVSGVRWFWSNTKDPVLRGSTSTRNGVIIGVPYSFSYEKVADIDLSKIITAGSKDIDKDSVEGRKHLSSLVLSEDAKKFALARELHFSDSKYVHINGLVGILIGGVGVLTAAKMNRSAYLNIEKTKRSFRILVYATLAFSVIYLQQEVLRFYFTKHHLKSDSKAASMGKEYAMGGIEYLSKLLRRNEALRKLAGKSGEEMYTPLGDEVSGYFSLNISASLRMKHLIDKTKTLYGEKDEKFGELIENIVKDTTSNI